MGVRTAVVVEGTDSPAFCPVMGTTPAATSNGALKVYGAPGTVREGPAGPDAIQVPSPRASGYSLGAEGAFAPDIYYVVPTRSLYPQTVHGPNDSQIPEPAGYYDRLPPTIANPPKVGTFRSMFQPRALLNWLQLNGQPQS
jgi:hypothetical protein